MKKIIATSALAILCVGTVQAETKNGGLFVEPILTYEQGETETDYPSPAGNSTGDIDGFGVGARLGFHVYEAVFLGVDGRYSMPTYKDSALDQNTDAEAYNYGPVIGFQTPGDLGIRVWGGYVMGGELDPDKDQDVDVKFKDAQGYRVGAGIKLGIASLNLEYQDLTYKESQIEEVGSFNFNNASTNDVELDQKSWIVSVSFPIAL